MKCFKIKKYLFEYYEGLLAPEIKKLVKDHLASCKDCAKEYSLMQKYKKEMNTLKKVKAPDDFLQKVHARIEEDHIFKKVIKWLFVPFKVKIPLEAVGVIATILIVVWLFSPFQEKREIIVTTKIYEETMQKPRERTRPVKPGLKRKKYAAMKGAKIKDISGAGKKAEMPRVAIVVKEQEEVVVELILLVKSDVVELDKSERSFQAEGAGVPFAPSEAKTKQVKKMKARAEKSLAMFKEAGAPAVMDEISFESEEEAGDVTEQVKKLIKRFKGNIIKEDYDKKRNLLNSITVEIPVKNYNVFLTNLNKIGELQKPLPISINKKDELIRNRIQFLREKLDSKKLDTEAAEER